MDFLGRLESFSARRKSAIAFILVAGYGVIAISAPPQAYYGVMVLGFAPLVILSLIYGWRLGGLFGMLFPIINAACALLLGKVEYDLGKGLAGVISGGMMGMFVGLMRDQWLRMRAAEETLKQHTQEKTSELQRQNDYLMALHETTLALINHLELHSLLESILSRARKLSNTQHGFIDLATSDGTGMRQELGTGNFAFLNGVFTNKGMGITGRVWESGKFMMVEDYAAWEGHIPAYKSGLHAIVCFPLKSHDEVVGVLGLAYEKQGQIFTPEQIRHLEQFAHLASLALENARLYEDAQEQLQKRENAEAEIRKLNEELEQRVIERTAELEYTNRELSSFSYSVSHDLRPPLRAIDGYSRIVLDEYGDSLPEEGQELLKKVRLYTQKMDRLINDILTFNRLGRHKLRRESIALEKLVKADFAHALKEFPSVQNVKLQCGELPTINADVTLLNHVFVNLLTNGIKFTQTIPNPSIEVGQEKMGEQTVYFVRDNGIGLEMKYAQKIFSVFERLHSDEEYLGTGVGLAIVQRAIQLHGGRIWINSAPGKGATFYFTIGENGEE